MSPGTEIDRGLAFLAERQRPSGEFEVLRGRDLVDVSQETERDHTPFATTLIAHSLGYSDAPGARAVVASAVRFVQAQMEPGGVWRYWPRGHEHHRAIPPDLDDTACASELLRRHGVPLPDNRPLLLANRDEGGLFYTWLAPRWRPPPRSGAFWRVAARRYRAPLRARMFWKLNESDPADVDGVVNANVLFYLGHDEATEAVVGHLGQIVRDGREDSCDKWHLNPFTFHYMLARCYDAGVEALGAVRDEAVARITARANGDGSIGSSVLDTALAACALRSWRADGAVVDAAAEGLRRNQRDDGSWPVVPMYWGGPERYYGWGSEELTSAYCLEALLRCAAT